MRASPPWLRQPPGFSAGPTSSAGRSAAGTPYVSSYHVLPGTVTGRALLAAGGGEAVLRGSPGPACCPCCCCSGRRCSLTGAGLATVMGNWPVGRGRQGWWLGGWRASGADGCACFGLSVQPPPPTHTQWAPTQTLWPTQSTTCSISRAAARPVPQARTAHSQRHSYPI